MEQEDRVAGGCAVGLAGQSGLYIYVFIYIYLFTIYKVNTYSTSTNLHDSVGSPITDSKWDGQRERRKGWTSRVSVFFQEEATEKWLPVTRL